MDDPNPFPRLTRRAALGTLWTGMGLLWLFDVFSLEATSEFSGSPTDWWVLASAVVAGVAVVMPDGVLALPWRAGAAALASGVMTVLYLTALPELESSWGLLESLCLLLLLARSARETWPPRLAAALCAALALAVVATPLRLSGTSDGFFSFVLTCAAGGAIGLGCYVRGLDARRRRAVADVRQSERLALARELHDFVAHHVTGIVVQAQAARTIRETAPEQVDPLLSGIERAGAETLESMRRLVRVLREDPTEGGSPVRPGELFPELAELVAAFSERDAPATLHFAEDARRAPVDPEVGTSVRHVVQEALTNVRRHAPGAPSVSVRISLEDGLRVSVHNEPPPGHPSSGASAEPLGGRGGLGLVGLAERAEAVGGTLDAGPAEDGGWRLTASFPVREALSGPASGAVSGSAA
ncbi:sensor histidine kinase [Streptomyces sp. NPDC048172]|uniref:sensor histidine kinase n=1 Tax=Streptomyces sp. NPDC048172 TaxID=3365505 RepID=UPI00371C0C2E